MITKKILIYWVACSLILSVGINYLDGLNINDDWPDFLLGIFLAGLLLVIVSIVLSVLLATFSDKSYRTPKKEQISVFIPRSSFLLAGAALFAFLVTRPSYSKSRPAESSLCKTVSEGVFLLNGCVIERRNGTQTETNSMTNEKETSKVKWISDCEYVLTNIEDSNDVTKVKITSVTDEGYQCVAIWRNRTSKHKLLFKNDNN